MFAVERDAEQQANIRANTSRYPAAHIRLIAGEAPSVLASLPAPERIFVGGSGGRLEELLRYCCTRLAPGGRLVANAVLAGTREMVPGLMHEAGLAVSVSEIAVTRYRPFTEKKKTTFNPIAIMVGQK